MENNLPALQPSPTVRLVGGRRVHAPDRSPAHQGGEWAKLSAGLGSAVGEGDFLMNTGWGRFHHQGERRRSLAHHPPGITLRPLPRRSRGPGHLARSPWACCSSRCGALDRSAGHRGPGRMAARPQLSRRAFSSGSTRLSREEERCSLHPAGTGLHGVGPRPFTGSRWWRCPPFTPS